MFELRIVLENVKLATTELNTHVGIKINIPITRI